MAKGDFKLAWKKYGFTIETIKQCKTVAFGELDEKSQDYWERCASFVESIKYLQVGRLSTKQRNWAFNVKKDLEKEGYY